MYDCCRMGVVESRLPLRHRLSHRREGESRGSRPEGKRLCRLRGIPFRHGRAMELRHLRYFVAVVEEGSLTTAAELRLHTSQPSLSRQIRDLEYQVGAQLLSRSVHGVELTAAGKAFLDHARLALAQVDAAVEAARRAAQPAKKTFAIGFQTGHEMNWLPRAMHVLRDELKNLDITVTSDYSPDLAEALLRGRLDVAFLRVEPTFDLCYEVVDHQPRSDSPAGIRRRDLHRRFEESRRAASRDGGLSAPLRARHQTGSWSGQRFDGHLAGCVHARAGPHARVCEEYAAMVRSQPSAGG